LLLRDKFLLTRDRPFDRDQRGILDRVCRH